MKKGILIFILLAIAGTLFLIPSFYRNKWNVIDNQSYEDWQVHYDRTVVARLVKTRQDGFLSAGGLLGLGNVSEWSYTTKVNNDQYNTYITGGIFASYLPYKSHPGFQGILFSLIDQLDITPQKQTLKVLRGLVAIASSSMIAVLAIGIGSEFGWLSSVFIMLFSATCQWMILPAGSIYWNLWAFFLPLVISVYLLAYMTKEKIFNINLFSWLIFSTILIKTLFTGFEIHTVVLVMATVPIVFFSINKEWGWKLFADRLFRVGIAAFAATLIGLAILSIQIIINDSRYGSAFSYILNRFGSHFGGNAEIYTNPSIQATKITAFELISKYLDMPALSIQLMGRNVLILYWHLIILFAVFTLVFALRHRKQANKAYLRKAVALITTTWYSILAPLSWILLFRPHSIIHPHVNSMAWQMPFTLLGFALCGFVITDFFKKENRPA